ncbi:MAG: septation regulator SpoVG [Clostridiales bacterium]|jgi:stage V sporulation protein G|nr:septation regulator SpoVG [Clostridiales bacterium]
MQITDIRVRKINSEGRMKAIISVTFDDSIVVHDIKVIQGQEKLFVAMPSRKTPDGEFHDVVHPINSETRTMLEEAILDAYEQAKTEQENDTTEEE